jgi:hypothetical protein
VTALFIGESGGESGTEEKPRRPTAEYGTQWNAPAEVSRAVFARSALPRICGFRFGSGSPAHAGRAVPGTSRLPDAGRFGGLKGSDRYFR